MQGARSDEWGRVEWGRWMEEGHRQLAMLTQGITDVGDVENTVVCHRQVAAGTDRGTAGSGALSAAGTAAAAAAGTLQLAGAAMAVLVAFMAACFSAVFSRLNWGTSSPSCVVVAAAADGGWRKGGV